MNLNFYKLLSKNCKCKNLVTNICSLLKYVSSNSYMIWVCNIQTLKIKYVKEIQFSSLSWEHIFNTQSQFEEKVPSHALSGFSSWTREENFVQMPKIFLP